MMKQPMAAFPVLSVRASKGSIPISSLTLTVLPPQSSGVSEGLGANLLAWLLDWGKLWKTLEVPPAGN